jgi:hypothetical protein
MAFQERGFIQLPPDSTGKKSGATGLLIIDFQGESSPNLLMVGQTIVGATSNAIGIITGIQRAGFANGEGQLFLDPLSVTGIFVVNENLNVSGTPYALVKANSPLHTIYYQKNVIVDNDIPSRRLGIDERGAARVTFSDGAPALNSFGGLISDSPSSVRQYVHAYDGLENEFFKESGVGGYTSYAPAERAVVLSTGGTASGAYCKRTSHYYHPYQPGTTIRCMQSVVLGDAGKDDVLRRWGMYDDDNGVFWELDGHQLNVVVRSNTSGSGIDTKIPQADWNIDPLDGTVKFDLDVSKANLYWIDVQWLGVGVVKFGVYEDDGTKTICHVVPNPNNLTTAYMRQATLPVRAEIKNVNTAVSSSDIKSICAVVQNLGSTTTQTYAFSAGTTSPKIITAADGEVPVLSFRPFSTFNGLSNNIVSLINDFTVFNSDAKATLIRVRRGSIPSGDSYGSSITVPGSSLEVDEAASGLYYAGPVLYSSIVQSGSVMRHNFAHESNDHMNSDIGILFLKDQLTQPSTLISAQVIGPGSSEISATFNWREVKN